MPRRDGTGPYSDERGLYGGGNRQRINGCRRDDRGRGNNRSRFYCQRNSDYFENGQTLIKNQAHYHEDALKRINSRLDSLKSESAPSE